MACTLFKAQGETVMNEVLAGNICSLGAMVTDSISSTRKKPREILAIQIISQLFYGAGTIILRGYSSTAQNVVAIFRNLAAIKGVKYRFIEWILIALGVILGLWWNNLGLLGWLPVAANLEYSIAMFRLKNNPRGLKIAFLINMLMYSVFSLIIRNYVGAAANLFVAVTTAVSLIRNKSGNPVKSDSGREEPPRA